MKRFKIFLISMSSCLLILAGGFSGCAGKEEQMGFVSADSGMTGSEETEVPGEESGSVEAVEEKTPEMILVYVCGAVENPGVVCLQAGSRLCDALEAAGGFTQDASVTSVNLAARLTDEEMICVPTVMEAEAAQKEQAVQELSGIRPVNINTADMNALCTLPGIGESRAQDIINYREKNGAFQSKEDIMQVSGIKESLYEKICDKISVE